MIGQFCERIMNPIEAVFLVLPLLLMVACTNANPPAVVDMPTVDKLPDIKELPDPFLMNNGRRVKTRADWKKRREEIKAIMMYYQYGHMPPAPKNITAEVLSSETVYEGSATKKHILLSMGPGRKIKVNVGIVIPKGKGPFPVILKNDSRIFNVPIVEELAHPVLVDVQTEEVAPILRGEVGAVDGELLMIGWRSRCPRPLRNPDGHIERFGLDGPSSSYSELFLQKRFLRILVK